MSEFGISDETAAPADEPVPRRAPTTKSNSGFAGAVVAAALMGLGEALEPDRTSVDIEEVGEAPDGADLLHDLYFGDLPPLT